MPDLFQPIRFSLSKNLFIVIWNTELSKIYIFTWGMSYPILEPVQIHWGVQSPGFAGFSLSLARNNIPFCIDHINSGSIFARSNFGITLACSITAHLLPSPTQAAIIIGDFSNVLFSAGIWIGFCFGFGFFSWLGLWGGRLWFPLFLGYSLCGLLFAHFPFRGFQWAHFSVPRVFAPISPALPCVFLQIPTSIFITPTGVTNLSVL